jgi:hypothetical protein
MAHSFTETKFSSNTLLYRNVSSLQTDAAILIDPPNRDCESKQLGHKILVTVF